MPGDASKMFGKNILNFLKILIDKEGKAVLHWEDDLITGTCIAHVGEVKNERVKAIMEQRTN
jgi:NAD(P) transhydrogenase subunit alpha